MHEKIMYNNFLITLFDKKLSIKHRLVASITHQYPYHSVKHYFVSQKASKMAETTFLKIFSLCPFTVPAILKNQTKWRNSELKTNSTKKKEKKEKTEHESFQKTNDRCPLTWISIQKMTTISK